MRRRFFFGLFSSVLFVPQALRSEDMVKKLKNEPAYIPESLPVLELKPGQVFHLPENPNYLETVYFKNDQFNWKQEPPTVLSTKDKVVGKYEPLSLDQNMSFALRYMG